MNTTASNNETEVWSGTPSQLRHLGFYTSMVLIALLLLFYVIKLHGSTGYSADWWVPLIVEMVPAGGALKRYLQTRCERITLTDQRLILRRGVLNRTTDYVELYRIKDSHFTQPFLERMLGLGTIRLRTTQDSAPVVELTGMKGPEQLWNQIRGLVEARRDAKGVREIDMNSETGGG